MKKLNFSRKAAIGIAAAATVGAIGLTTASAVLAQNANGEYSPLVERIAETFNLNEAEVQEVFVEVRDEREDYRLDKAVEDGDITSAQVTLVKEKSEEFHTAMEALRDEDSKTEETHEARQELVEEYSDWAEANDIPIRLIIGGGKAGGPGMSGRGMGSSERDSDKT